MTWKIVVLVAAALSVAGIAVAQGGGGSQNVTLCAEKAGGELSLGARGKCSKGEKKVTVAKQGPAGPQGAQGADGADGTPADLAPEPWRNVQSPAVATANCPSQPGFFCVNGGGPSWRSLTTIEGETYPPVAFHKDAMGYVHLRGVLSQGGQGAYFGGVAFYLPPGYRPTDGAHEFPARSSVQGTNVQAIRIRTDGAVVSPDACCPTLDGVVFRP